MSTENKTAEFLDVTAPGSLPFIDFEISEYETGLFNETEDELMASLIFEEDISFDNSDLINESDLTIDELEEYLESDIDLSIEF